MGKAIRMSRAASLLSSTSFSGPGSPYHWSSRNLVLAGAPSQRSAAQRSDLSAVQLATGLDLFLRYPQSMTGATDSITVYRSADTNAEEDAATIRDALISAGLHPEVVDDDTPGVVEGTFEVRVPPF